MIKPFRLIQIAQQYIKTNKKHSAGLVLSALQEKLTK